MWGRTVASDDKGDPVAPKKGSPKFGAGSKYSAVLDRWIGFGDKLLLGVF